MRSRASLSGPVRAPSLNLLFINVNRSAFNFELRILRGPYVCGQVHFEITVL